MFAFSLHPSPSTLHPPQCICELDDLVRLRHGAEAVDFGGEGFEFLVVDLELIGDGEQKWPVGEFAEAREMLGLALAT